MLRVVLANELDKQIARSEFCQIFFAFGYTNKIDVLRHPSRFLRWYGIEASSAPCGVTAHPGRAFSNALADGRLEVILANELERIKAESGEAC
jgi:hypothetical protein